MQTASSAQREILTVSGLNSRVRKLLESEFRQVWVEGEISNLVRPASGHWYFTLKDDKAQVRCAMFANRNRTLRMPVQNGMQVIVRARVSLYEGRGDYQLIAENLIDAGAGRLQREFEALKQKLAAEGLFDADHKQPLPHLPVHIGVITSPTGAAIRDILTVLKRRFPAIKVSLIPAQVQGKEAAGQLVAAIEHANRLDRRKYPLDVLIVGRGGGSLEDLWPFNEEAVARAIFVSRIPVVSAVGHETDFTISDFVADARAPTPSAAAEMLSPDQRDWRRTLEKLQRALTGGLERHLQHASRQLEHLRKRLRHPRQQLQEQAQRVDDMEVRLRTALHHQLALRQARLQTLGATLGKHHPGQRIERLLFANQQLAQRLESAMRHQLEGYRHRLKANSLALHTLSPLQTLSRGYAIVRDEQKQIIRSVQTVQPGDRVTTQLQDGQLHCAVEAIEENT